MPRRVRISAPEERDRRDFIAAMRDSADLHGRWITPATTDEGFDELLERHLADDFEAFVVRTADDDAIAGAIYISNIFRRNLRSAYVGYAAVTGHERRGLMTEALGLVLDEAFGRLGLHRIEANIQPGNAASIALVRRLGFVREGYSENYLQIDGVWQDHERWAIRSEIWPGAD
ncbi:MAG: GNAT family protein [Solirubrobacterales bacterium]